MTTNGKITDEEARRLSGDGATTPPYMELPGTSEGTLSKGSYRRSQWGRLSTVAVVNDDGTKITAGVEASLSAMLALLTRITTSLEHIDARGERIESDMNQRHN